MTNRFLNLKVSKKVKFMNEDIEIIKLTVAQVMSIQELAKNTTNENATESDSIRLLTLVIQLGAPELKDLTNDEVNSFPMDELTKLSNEILKYSGIGNKTETK